MSARTSITSLVTAMLAGDVFDLGTNGVLKAIPNLDNTHTFQLGAATRSLGFRVYLGAEATYFDLSANPATLTLSNVAFSPSSLTVNTMVVNTMEVLNTADVTGLTTVSTTANSTANVSCVGLTVPGGTVVLTTPTADVATISGNTTVDALISTNTFSSSALMYDGVTTDVLTVASNTNTVDMNMTGTLTLPLVEPTTLNVANLVDTVDANAANMNMSGVTEVPVTATASGMNIPGDLSMVSTWTLGDPQTITTNLTMVPAVDDVGANVIGDATHGVDVKIFLGSASTYALFDRGATQLTLRTVPLNTNAPVVINAAVTSDGVVTANALVSGGNLNLAGALNTVTLATVTGAAAVNTVSSADLTVIPAVDDTATATFGNATHSGDVSVVLGAANNVLFDQGASALTLSGVELNSNSTLSGTTLNITGELGGTTLNSTDMNMTGALHFAGNASVTKEYVNCAVNTLITEADSGKILTNIGAGGAVSLTLPRPEDVVDNTISFEVMAPVNQTLTVDVLGVRSAVFVAANKEYFFRANPAPVNTEPCTFACWYKTTENKFMVLAEHGNSSAFHFRALRMVTGGIQMVCFESTPGQGAIWLNTGTSDGEWHHAVGVCKNTTHREIWVDGDLKDTDTNLQTVTTTLDRYHMGASRGLGAGGPTGNFDGSLAYNETYNTALNSDQIGYLYNSGAGRSFRFLKDNSGDTNNPYDNMRSCYEYLEASGGSTDSKNGFGTNDGNTVGRSHTDGPIKIPGSGDFLGRAGASDDKAYGINTVNGHGRLAFYDTRWVFLPYSGTTFTIEA